MLESKKPHKNSHRTQHQILKLILSYIVLGFDIYLSILQKIGMFLMYRNVSVVTTQLREIILRQQVYVSEE